MSATAVSKRGSAAAVRPGGAAAPAQKYIRLSRLAREIGEGYDRVYSFVLRHNRRTPNAPIDFFTLPTEAGLHVRQEDAAMIQEVFSSPELFATKRTRG